MEKWIIRSLPLHKFYRCKLNIPRPVAGAAVDLAAPNPANPVAGAAAAAVDVLPKLSVRP